MREVPKKNYLICFIILISVISLTIVIANLYNNRLRKTSVMYNYLSEIKRKDLNTFLLEKPNVVIYISDKYDASNNKIEKKIKKDIMNENLSDYIVFLNLTDDKLNYIETINEKYDGKLKKRMPMIVVFEDGKIKKSYYDLENVNIKRIIGEMK